MALYQAKQIKAGYPLPAPDNALNAIPMISEFIVPAGGLQINDVIEMGGLPNNCIPIDGVLHTSAGGAGATCDWGLLSGSYAVNDGARTCGNDFAAAVALTNAAITRVGKPMLTAPQADDTTGYGLKVTGAVWPAGMQVRMVVYVAPEVPGMV